jgi:tetratricopeptide (TPR) repeat protein
LLKIFWIADISAGIEFLEGNYDSVTCQGCGGHLSDSPLIAINSFLEDRCILWIPDVPPDDAQTIGSSLKDFIQPVIANPKDTLIVNDRSALYHCLRDIAHRHTTELIRIMTTLTGGRDALAREWRGAQGEALLIARGATYGPFFGIELFHSADRSTETEKSQFLDTLNDFQACLWEAIAVGGLVVKERAVPLEELICRCVDVAPIVDSAFALYMGKIEKFLRRADEDPRFAGPGALPSLYVMEAVNASIHRRMRKDNPRAEKWCSVLVKAELRATLDPDGFVIDDLMRVSPERARDTISLDLARNALQDILLVVMRTSLDANDRGETFSRLSDTVTPVAKSLGRPHLADDLANAVVVDWGLSTENLLAAVRKILIEHEGNEDSLSLDPLGAAAVAARDHEKISAFADAFLTAPELNLRARAMVLEWFAARMKELGLPKKALDKLGDRPGEWERNIPPRFAAALANERSNSLRLMARPAEALAENERAFQLLSTDDFGGLKDVLLRNQGVFYREVGRIPEALARFYELLPGSIGNDRAGLLENLATTLSGLSRYQEAANAFAEAQEILSGRKSMRVPALAARELAMRARAGDFSRVATLFSKILPIEDTSPETLPLLAEAVKSIPKHLVPSGLSVERVESAIAGAMESLFAEGNALHGTGLLRYLGANASRTDRSVAKRLWKRDVAISEELNIQPDPRALVGLAHDAVLNAEFDSVASYLFALIPALTAVAGTAAATSATMDWLKHLDWQFGDLLDAALQTNAPAGAIQFINDCQRNLLQRAHLANRVENLSNSTMHRLPEDCATLVARGVEPFAVFEWIGVDRPVLAMMTIITELDVERYVLEIPDIPLAEIALDLDHRIDCWNVARPGDPFDIPAFVELRQWFDAEASSFLQAVRHVVIIDHSAMPNFPIHLMIDASITTSYSSHWLAVWNAAAASVAGAERAQMASVYIPSSNESAGVLSAMENSRRADMELGRRGGQMPTFLQGPAADTAALQEVLATHEFAKIVCHGHLSTLTRETALLVAHEGSLPPRTSTFLNKPEALDYRFGWSQALATTKAPATLFLGVCSAAAATVLGHQERMGLFSPFSASGTRTIVAPRWKIEASTVLPILDATITAWTNGAPLSAALYNASRDAKARGVPGWQADALVIEGTWK